MTLAQLVTFNVPQRILGQFDLSGDVVLTKEQLDLCVLHCKKSIVTLRSDDRDAANSYAVIYFYFEDDYTIVAKIS